MNPGRKWLILILMGIFLAIMYGYSEGAEKLTVNLVTHTDDLDGSAIKAALADRLSRFGVRQSDDSDCIVHIVYYKAQMNLKHGMSIQKRVSIMFVGGIFVKQTTTRIPAYKFEFKQQRAVDSFQGCFYWDKDHIREGFDTLATMMYTGILEVYAGVK